MVKKKNRQTSRAMWTYAYQIVPAQAEERLHTIRTLLDHEHAEAQRRERTWVGRVVVEKQVTHILVVSDSAEQDHEVNRRLESELRELQVGFSLTAPMAVTDEPDPSGTPPRNGGDTR